MSLAKRIIPCLDVDAGRVVKGVRFVDIRDAGDPVEIARRYDLALTYTYPPFSSSSLLYPSPLLSPSPLPPPFPPSPPRYKV